MISLIQWLVTGGAVRKEWSHSLHVWDDLDMDENNHSL